MSAATGLKYGVSLYSYTGDMNTVLTIDDAMAEIASAGATGIEILGESNIRQYPNPPAAWVDQWWASLEKHGLQPTNYCSWVDIGLSRGRDLSPEEGAEILRNDIALASTLGFSTIRPKFGVVSMDLDPHPDWERIVEANLDFAAERNIIICPEIHAPTPIKHKVVDDYIAFIERTGSPHFRLMIDTGIFQRAATNAIQPGISEDGHKAGWMSPRRADERPGRRPPLRRVHPGEILRHRRRPGRSPDSVGGDRPDARVSRIQRMAVQRIRGRSHGLPRPEQVRRHHALLRSIERAIRSGEHGYDERNA